MLICHTRMQTLKLPNNENIVFLGNSHIECDINDAIVANSFNFARSNDYLEQTYCKLKLLKKYYFLSLNIPLYILKHRISLHLSMVLWRSGYCIVKLHNEYSL